MNRIMIGPRRKARIAVLQTLYEIDYSSHNVDDVLNRSLEEKTSNEDTVIFARELTNGIIIRKDSIDSILQRFAPLFPLIQIATIDRNILRIATFEIVFNSTVPLKAVINEAIELAKSFGSENSPKFINGVLGSLISNLDIIKKEFGYIENSKLLQQSES
jgi:transcription antitermination protein NusB